MITSSRKMNASQTIYAFLAGVSFILTFVYSETAIDCARASLSLCAKTIIPSLFPFIVISEIIVNSGLGNVIGKIFNKIFQKLFGISSPSACAVVLGALCGFPIGTKIILSLLDSGTIDKSEAEHLITFCNNPSSSFLINIVGISLYSNSAIGILLYCVTLINSALIGIIQTIAMPSKKNKPILSHQKQKNSKSIFINAVTNSIPNILVICSYIVFFSVLTGCIEKILSLLHCSILFSVSLHGIIEMTGGVAKSATLGNNILSLCLTAFFIGWSGLSVHCQMVSLCNGYNLNLKKYFISKIILGFLNALSISIIYYIKPSAFSPKQNTISTIYFPDLHEAWAKWCIILFAIAIVIYIFRKKHTSTVSIIY